MSDLWNQLRMLLISTDRKRPDGWHNTTHHLKLQQGESPKVLRQPSWIAGLSLEEKHYHLPLMKQFSNWLWWPWARYLLYVHLTATKFLMNSNKSHRDLSKANSRQCQAGQGQGEQQLPLDSSSYPAHFLTVRSWVWLTRVCYSYRLGKAMLQEQRERDAITESNGFSARSSKLQFCLFLLTPTSLQCLTFWKKMNLLKIQHICCFI